MEERRRHILAIINPVSGTGNKDKIPRLIDTVVDHERNLVSIMATEYPGHANEIAQQAVIDGIDVVVAIGGDGTVIASGAFAWENKPLPGNVWTYDLADARAGLAAAYAACADGYARAADGGGDGGIDTGGYGRRIPGGGDGGRRRG